MGVIKKIFNFGATDYSLPTAFAARHEDGRYESNVSTILSLMPMIYAALPPSGDSSPRPLPFYLAMEEHLARNYPGLDFFFMWQVEPTVIFGRCQDPFAEVNLEFCRREGIQTYRRKSGGGCVYADRDNIMLSHVTATSSVTSTFSAYCSLVASTLRSLGLPAESTGRNDIIIGERKVSGNAFYNLHDRAIVHGTMLFDADPGRMARALTPSSAKLDAKGVSSVRSRVTTIREHLPQLTIGEFKDFCRRSICTDCLTMTPGDIAAIEDIARGYYAPEWIWGRHASRGTAPSARRRIEGVGEFETDVRLSPPAEPGLPPTIRNIDLRGDFFLLSDLDSALLDRLRGVEFTREAILRALEDVDTGAAIASLTAPQLADLLVSAPA